VIQSVDRSVRILTALQGGRRMSLGEIASQLALPPSTVHGIIRTLLTHGMVAQERDSGRYRLGPATLRLGNVYLDTLELRARVAARAEDLAERTGLAVRTGVLLLGDVIVVHHAPHPGGSRQMPEVGIVIPAHACALGKVLLAYDTDALTQFLASPEPPRSMTGQTITDLTTLQSTLAQVRETGTATEEEEALIGECGIAAPLVEATSDVAGAISLVVPSLDWPAAPNATAALIATARAVSREMGAQEWPPARNSS
jgi:DNA-binding IclR family transcriptional regulator